MLGVVLKNCRLLGTCLLATALGIHAVSWSDPGNQPKPAGIAEPLPQPWVDTNSPDGKPWWRFGKTHQPAWLPAPNGTYVRQWQKVHINNAAADEFVIYRNEWLGNKLTLTPYGQFHLLRIVERLPFVPYRLVIQPECDEKLDQERRLEIVKFLYQRGVPDALNRVVLDYPAAEGLFGDEAARAYFRLLWGGMGQGIGRTQGIGGFGMGGGGLGGIRGF